MCDLLFSTLYTSYNFQKALKNKREKEIKRTIQENNSD